jgi:tryptophan 6-halogenase
MGGRIRRVVIVGGGTAGWMTAAYLGKALAETVKITVLEAPAIPKIGVGEATAPNLQRAFFDYLGLPEDEWMKECNASFKVGVKFINWRTPGPGSRVAREWRGRPDHFYHPFGLLPEQDQIPLSHYWSHKLLNGTTDEPFDYSCFNESAIMDHNLAPRFPDGSPATRYAWHFDAHLVADFLRRFATTRQGVEHIQDEMTEVHRDADGFITMLSTKSGATLSGDLFIDCSGFRGLLINKTLGEPFIDMGDQLLCDSAVATSIPHDDQVNGVEPYTSAIAMKSGWTWRIPMLGRFGSGYVYSSKFASQDEATEEFCQLWGLDPEHTQFNQIRFRVGRNRRSWVKNCVSIGLASCFLEPLESTGIYFIYSAIYQLVKHFPDRDFSQVLIDRFNREIATTFADTKDFIQAHFHLGPRTDTPFWQANKEICLDDGIREKLAMFKAGMPVNAPAIDEDSHRSSLSAEFRNFWTNGSYYCIFTGLGVTPDYAPPILHHKPGAVAAAESLFERVKQRQKELAATLPSNYEYLRNLHGLGATASVKS